MTFTTTDTFDSLVDEVITSLQGWGVDNDQVMTLVNGVSATDLQFTLSGDISRGLIEIGQELIWIDTVDAAVATAQPWGRGFKGTTPAAHAAGSMVSVSPSYPRSVVAREVNNAIRAVYPTLYAVTAANVTVDENWQAALPADLDRVLMVEWQTPTGPWSMIDAWEAVHVADPATFSTGKGLLLGRPTPPGATVRVTYAAPPSLLSTGDAPFTATGLHPGARDVVVLGAAARLLPWMDAGSLPKQTVTADLMDQQVPVGAAVSVSREIRNRYLARLGEERQALQARHLPRAHAVRT